LATESELANDKALISANERQELLETGLDAKLTQQAKLVLCFTAFEIFVLPSIESDGSAVAQ